MIRDFNCDPYGQFELSLALPLGLAPTAMQRAAQHFGSKQWDSDPSGAWTSYADVFDRGYICFSLNKADSYLGLFISGVVNDEPETEDDRFDFTKPLPTSLDLDSRLVVAKLIRTLLPGLKREQVTF